MENRPEAGKKTARTPGRRTQYPVWSKEQDFVLPTSPQPGGLPCLVGLQAWRFSTKDPNCCCCSVAKSCLTFCDPMDCSPPGSSVHGTSQASTLSWVAISIFLTQGSNPHLLPRLADSLPLSHLGREAYEDLERLRLSGYQERNKSHHSC